MSSGALNLDLKVVVKNWYSLKVRASQRQVPKPLACDADMMIKELNWSFMVWVHLAASTAPVSFAYTPLLRVISTA